MKPIRQVLVTGGAGYVGAALVPRLLDDGYRVRVLDLYLFGEEPLDTVRGRQALEELKGDIRDRALVAHAVRDCDAVIHLACVSNDPSFELNPALSRGINYDAFEPLVDAAKASGVSRFIFASTSSVYGVSDANRVAEDHPLVPITDYNRYKGLCEPILLARQSPEFTTVVVRPATVCGYSPRQRLDLTVNILTAHAAHLGRITVFGGDQMRPNIHIDDMVDAYRLLLRAPAERLAGQVFNVGYENHTVRKLAETVASVVGRREPGRPRLPIVVSPSDDRRSYRICSEKIRRELGFVARRTVEDAVGDLLTAFQAGLVPDAMTDPRYHNIRTMQASRFA